MTKRDLDERTMISISQEIKQRRPSKIQRKCYRDRDKYLFESRELLINNQIKLLEYQQRIRNLTYGYIKYHEENNDGNFENDV